MKLYILHLLVGVTGVVRAHLGLDPLQIIFNIIKKNKYMSEIIAVLLYLMEYVSSIFQQHIFNIYCITSFAPFRQDEFWVIFAMVYLAQFW